MNLFRSCSLVLPFTVAIACTSPTESEPSPPGPSPLDGAWVGAVENGSPSGYYRRSLRFEANSSFVSETRSYGIYPGQPRDELSAYTRSEGTYRTDGDRLVFEPRRLVWWDRFYGATSPEQIREPYPGTIFDDARYEVLGQQLTLRFTIYPADAPEPAEFVYTRVW